MRVLMMEEDEPGGRWDLRLMGSANWSPQRGVLAHRPLDKLKKVLADHRKFKLVVPPGDDDDDGGGISV